MRDALLGYRLHCGPTIGSIDALDEWGVEHERAAIDPEHKALKVEVGQTPDVLCFCIELDHAVAAAVPMLAKSAWTSARKLITFLFWRSYWRMNPSMAPNPLHMLVSHLSHIEQ